MSELQMSTFMKTQIEEIKQYCIDNTFTGKSENELFIEWITLYAKEFRENYCLV